MSFSSKDKKKLTEYMHAIVHCISKFISEDKAKILLEETRTIHDFIDKVKQELKIMEAEGWDGTDLNEEQLNTLTLISDVYLKRNKSKYKKVETPSEIIGWFSMWIQSIFTKNELKWKKEEKNNI